MAANTSLAALYRPQTFAEVVGQDMVKSILSRAAREDRIAPAYLLSGTRGVGKTTIARIFAKALNCEHAPTGEPCNQCEACRRITQGNFVDVVEIDGASTRGIEDIRRLRDVIGYAPLEGRYKVFIIDEAHMLTKEAFNALLKTLEEPPARVTFIMATTEQHKFPVTIISRCQHFVFRQIPEAVLEAHICDILQKEGRTFEKEAAHLIARRGAGSVRDSMSMLGQVLALGSSPHETLTAKQVRDVLGMAGREVLDRLLDALADQNVPAITALVGELLAQGVDMGFFLREFASLWRSLFLIRQVGGDAGKILDISESEQKRLSAMAFRFTLTYLHAAWQMTLDSQRRILTSLEPSAGLELLLLNLSMLPRLLPLEELSPCSFSLPACNGAEPSGAGNLEETKKPIPQPPIACKVPEQDPKSSAEGTDVPVQKASPQAEGRATSPEQPELSTSSPSPLTEGRKTAETRTPEARKTATEWESLPVDVSLPWESFLALPQNRNPLLPQVSGEVRGNWLVLQASSPFVSQQLQKPEIMRNLESHARSWAGRPLRIAFRPPQKVVRTEAEHKEEIQTHPLIKKFQDDLDARLVGCIPLSR